MPPKEYSQVTGRVDRLQDEQLHIHIINQKLCSIEDIFKLGLYMYAKGVKGYELYFDLESAGKLFNTFYDMSIWELDAYYLALTQDVAEYVCYNQ
jgi:hypothetical protein